MPQLRSPFRLPSPLPALVGGLVAALLLGASPAAAQQVRLESAASGRVVSASGHALGIMRRALRFVTTAQEAYFAEHASYTTDVAALQRALRSTWGDSVRVEILFADRRGWSGTAVHPAAEGKSCVAFVGRAGDLPPLPTTTAAGKRPAEEGVPVCDDP